MAKSKIITAANTIYNAVRGMSANTLANLPVAGTVPWGECASAVLANSSLENQFYQNLHDYIYEYVAYKATYENNMKFLKKGEITNGAGIREYFVGMVDAMPYIKSDVEKQELKRYITDMFEAVHVLNLQRYYPATIGRVQFRTMLQSEEGVIRMVDLIKDSIYTSSEWDEKILTVTLLQKQYLAGLMKVVPVNTASLDNVIIELRTLARDLEEPRRDCNAYGVPNNTPLDRQVLCISNRTEATLGVKVIAEAFHRSEVDYLQKRVNVRAFDEIYDKQRLDKLRVANPDIPEFSADDLTSLGDIIAIVFDERLIQIWDFIHELWEKELASTMEITYFYHVWQMFSLSPFANCVALVKSTATTTYPATVTANVVSKTQTAKGVQFQVEITASGIVGGRARLIETEALATAGVRALRNGTVTMLATSDGGPLTAQIDDVTYTAVNVEADATADPPVAEVINYITPSTAVGAHLTLTKDV